MMKDNTIIRAQTFTVTKKGDKFQQHHIDFDYVDIFALFCPDNKECYYIPKNKLINIKSAFWLRIKEGKKNNKLSNWAKNFQNIQDIFV